MARKANGLFVLATVIMSAALALVAPGAAAGEITGDDLRAISNALGYLGGYSRGSPIAIGVVYLPDAPDSKTQAAQVATALDALPGPNQSHFHSEPLTIKEFSQTTSHFEAVLVLPDTISQASVIADAARRHRVVTISADPSCLNAKCCTLMIRAEGRVRIVLDTAMADSVGANFSSVFTMMVERR